MRCRSILLTYSSSGLSQRSGLKTRASSPKNASVAMYNRCTDAEDYSLRYMYSAQGNATGGYDSFQRVRDAGVVSHSLFHHGLSVQHGDQHDAVATLALGRLTSMAVVDTRRS